MKFKVVLEIYSEERHLLESLMAIARNRIYFYTRFRLLSQLLDDYVMYDHEI
jgi:hypothetical protein